jgi:hypothetical protein
LAKQVGCDIDHSTTNKQLDCLQHLPSETLLKGAMIGFTVSVDGEFAPKDAVVPVSCEETVLKGNYDENINLMIGSNTEEGLLMTYPAYLDPRFVIAVSCTAGMNHF